MRRSAGRTKSVSKVPGTLLSFRSRPPIISRAGQIPLRRPVEQGLQFAEWSSVDWGHCGSARLPMESASALVSAYVALSDRCAAFVTDASLRTASGNYCPNELWMNGVLKLQVFAA